MSFSENPYHSPSPSYDFAAQAAADERSSFIVKTYLHLTGAVFLFVALEAVLLNLPGTGAVVQQIFATRFGWLMVLGGFILVSWIAESWARSAVSPAMQYMGLGLYVVAESVIFVPLLYLANQQDSNIIPTAGIATLGLFFVLTAIVFITRKDFSFLRTVLMFAGFAAMGLILAAIFGGFTLGPVFCVAIIALACGYILYHTSNVMHHYRIGQHIAAALALFAAIALLFWYVVLLMFSRD